MRKKRMKINEQITADRDFKIMRSAQIAKGKRKFPEFDWIDVRGMPQIYPDWRKQELARKYNDENGAR